MICCLLQSPGSLGAVETAAAGATAECISHPHADVFHLVAHPAILDRVLPTMTGLCHIPAHHVCAADRWGGRGGWVGAGCQHAVAVWLPCVACSCSISHHAMPAPHSVCGAGTYMFDTCAVVPAVRERGTGRTGMAYCPVAAAGQLPARAGCAPPVLLCTRCFHVGRDCSSSCSFWCLKDALGPIRGVLQLIQQPAAVTFRMPRRTTH